MSYTLVDLFATPPSERLIFPRENPNYPVVFVARWPKTAFASHSAFCRQTEMYDTAMQGFIQGMTLNELTNWFEPHEDYDLLSPYPPDVSPERIEDSVLWMKRNFPTVEIPWLKVGDHTEILSETEGEFGELIAYGDSGYLYVFVADMLE
jgi:hypothetical protein